MKVKPPRNIVLRSLQQGIINIQFEKRDGNLRDMKATLLSTHIPSEHIAESNPNPRTNTDPDLIRCFDIEANGWRSFKISTLTRFNQ